MHLKEIEELLDNFQRGAKLDDLRLVERSFEFTIHDHFRLSQVRDYLHALLCPWNRIQAPRLLHVLTITECFYWTISNNFVSLRSFPPNSRSRYSYAATMEAAFMDSGTTVDKVSKRSWWLMPSFISALSRASFLCILLSTNNCASSIMMYVAGWECPSIVIHWCHCHCWPCQDDTRSQGDG